MSIETPSSPRIDKLRVGLLSEKKNPTQEELASLKDEIHRETNAKKKFELQKKLVRLERFDNLKEAKSVTDTRQKEAIEKTIAIKDFDSVRNSDLLTLKKRGIDIANLVLVNTSNPDKEVQSSDMKAGDSFIVNFWANKSLDRRTGAGDILPPNIRTVKINGIECERRNTPRPGYYNDSKKPSYQDIHDGDTIEILSRGDATTADNEANEKQWKKERVRDTIINHKKSLSTLNEDYELSVEVKNMEDVSEFQWANAELGTNGFALSNEDFKNIATRYSLGAKTPDILRLMTAIYGQESSWNYNAWGQTITNWKSKYKWERAIWRYQIMPSNWQAWWKELFQSTPEVTPENQDKIAFSKICEYYKTGLSNNTNPESYVKFVAKKWYGPSESANPPSSVYQSQVLARYENISDSRFA